MFSNIKKIPTILLSLAVLLLCLLDGGTTAAETVTVQALVDRDAVTVGETLLLEIRVDGDDEPLEPDLSQLQDFTVEPRGGGQNNRESITIVNGRMNRVSERGYVFRYALTPKRDGILTIPAIGVAAAGKTLQTRPVSIRVSEPTITDEFRLTATLPKSAVYVGEPLILTLKWYVNRDVAEFRFDLPFLDEPRFTFAPHPEDDGYQGQDAVPVNLNGSKAVTRKGLENLDGVQYTTLSLRLVVIPREPGEFSLGRARVFSKVVSGYRQRRPGQPLDDLFNRDLFNDFFGGRQPVYSQLVTEAADLVLEVRPQPSEGRPQYYSGLVGSFSIAAEAEPTEVNVGDPITLTLMVTGSEFMENVGLSSLEAQPGMANNFKVPAEMSPGEISGRVKVFTQTIRARHLSVTEIPPVSLGFFNPETGRYETASTKAIPLTVHGTKIVTASDAEGISGPPAQHELASVEQGIAHNYVGEDILKSQALEVGSWFASLPGLALVLLPPGLYLLVLVPVFVRRRRLQNGDLLSKRRAVIEFSKEVGRLQKTGKGKNTAAVSGLVEAMRIYFSRRLSLPPGTLVYQEVAPHLQKHGVAADLLAELQQLLERCEAYHYGGAKHGTTPGESIEQMLAGAVSLIKKIDRCIS
jgi:hypothetical protein